MRRLQPRRNWYWYRGWKGGVCEWIGLTDCAGAGWQAIPDRHEKPDDSRVGSNGHRIGANPDAPRKRLQRHRQRKPEEKKESDTYYTEDIVLWNLPTAHHLDKKALMIDFTHRFTFDEAFDPGAVSIFLGWTASPFSSWVLLTESPTGSSQASIALQPLSEESFSFPRVFNSRARIWVIRFRARSVSASKEPITSGTNTSQVWRSH